LIKIEPGVCAKRGRRRPHEAPGLAAITCRLGVDIGGTFTNAILVDERTGAARGYKIPSTPQDPSVALARIVEQVLGQGSLPASAVGLVVHGTTVATNAIIEGKLARTGFVATEGFRDMLEIARQIRPVLYDLQFEKPAALVARFLAFGVRERLDAQGNVLIDLNEADVQRAGRELRAQGVETVASAFCIRT